MFIHFWEREREREPAWVGEGQRERETIGSRLQALSCQHRARFRAQTHQPWDHDLSWSRTEPPRRPSLIFLERSTLIHIDLLIFLNYCIVHVWIRVLHFIYLFTCWWKFTWFPLFCYHKVVLLGAGRYRFLCMWYIYAWGFIPRTGVAT